MDSQTVMNFMLGEPIVEDGWELSYNDDRTGKFYLRFPKDDTICTVQFEESILIEDGVFHLVKDNTSCIDLDGVSGEIEEILEIMYFAQR